MTIRIAIDTGGTFTDLVCVDQSQGRAFVHKTASTPDDPSRALVEGILEVLRVAGAEAQAVELLVHGTTVATNALLQRQGARVALITTRGFRDVLQIQRQDRPSLYDMRQRRPVPLVPRRLRFELTERLRFDGTVETPVDADQLRQIINHIADEQCDAVAVGLLHSYVNGAHEREVAQALAERLPAAAVSVSHQLVAEHGEYERFNTCAINAFVQPVMQRYLQRIDDRLSNAGVTTPVVVMKSNGGVMPAGRAGHRAVETLLSGPAGGVMAGVGIAAQHARNNLITADMGGTSLDVAVIHQGQPSMARDAELAGLAMKVPMLDIHTVGAGGGSLGWIDAGGALRVGPKSAGAVPGPACYGRGGSRPTVTDANLVLGRLAPESLLSGQMTLNLEAARRAIHDHLARPLGLSIADAAEGMIRVVNTTMTAAIRKLTIERGHDPREFALCAYGGAGPMHAAELAQELGVAETVIPVSPGVTSAVGLLMSPPREDRVQTFVCPLASLRPGQLATALDRLAQETLEQTAAALQGRPAEVAFRVGLRYQGQGHELPVAVRRDDLSTETLASAFHQAHEQSYGFRRDEEPVELACLWVVVTYGLETQGISTSPIMPTSAPRPAACREIVFAGQSYESLVLERANLTPGTPLQGPAVIEQLDSTTVLWPGQSAEVAAQGLLVLAPIELSSTRRMKR